MWGMKTPLKVAWNRKACIFPYLCHLVWHLLKMLHTFLLRESFSEADAEIKHAKCHYFSPFLKCIYTMWKNPFLALYSERVGSPKLQIVSPRNAVVYLLLWWDIVESVNDQISKSNRPHHWYPQGWILECVSSVLKDHSGNNLDRFNWLECILFKR